MIIVAVEYKIINRKLYTRNNDESMLLPIEVNNRVRFAFIEIIYNEAFYPKAREIYFIEKRIFLSSFVFA